MNKQTSSKNIIINYGLILGGTSIATSVILYALNKHLDDSWEVGVISFLIMAGVITLGIKTYKTNRSGFLSFGEAIKIGVGIAVIGGIIGILYQQIFQTVIEPDFMEQKLNIIKEKMLDSGMDEDMATKQIEMAQKFQNPFLTSAIGLVIAAFFGFVISAIAGGILQKKREDSF